MPGVPTIKLPSWYGVSEDTQLADFSSVSDLTSSILFILQAYCKCYSLVYIVIIVEKSSIFSRYSNFSEVYSPKLAQLVIISSDNNLAQNRCETFTWNNNPFNQRIYTYMDHQV